MTAKGKDLLFISRIKPDGSGVWLEETGLMRHLDEFEFTLSTLSVTAGTYIAQNGFCTYVVIKKETHP